MTTETEYDVPPLSEADQRNADEIEERRIRLMEALRTATTAFEEAAEQIEQLGSNRVFDEAFADDPRLKRLVAGTGQFLDALVADVDHRIVDYVPAVGPIAAARRRAGDNARIAYLDALADAVPLFSAHALAHRPFDQS